MGVIEKLVSSKAQVIKSAHYHFRLWLTTCFCSIFPIPVLQNSLKLSLEQPQGIRAQMVESYKVKDFDRQFAQMAAQQDKMWPRMFYCLCMFHSLLKERRRFGVIGWNKLYEFTNFDLAISLSYVAKYLEAFQQLKIFPWDALHYIIGDINYGCKVTDQHDLKLLKILLARLFNPQILKPDFAHAADAKTLYEIPALAAGHQYWDLHMALLAKYPATDNIAIFGAHPNAEINGRIYQSEYFNDTIIQLIPKVVDAAQSLDSSSATEQLLKEKCRAILDRIPEPFDENALMERISRDDVDSLNITLLMEIKRYNALIAVIRSTLHNAINSINGTQQPTPDIEETSNKLYNNQVPDAFKKNAYQSQKPLAAWISHLLDRLGFFRDWIDRGTPKTFWMPGFFVIQSFLTAVLLNFARKKKVAVDSLEFDFRVIPVEQEKRYAVGTDAPDNGCFVHGLFLDGASWDGRRNVLKDPSPGQLYQSMPHIWFIVREKRGWDLLRLKYNNLHAYECPLYITTKRTSEIIKQSGIESWILDVKLPYSRTSEANSETWTIRGVGLITQLDD